METLKSKEEKRRLLDFAYRALSSLFDSGALEIPECDTECGAFVTLRKKGALRGCIGYMVAIAPLYKMIASLVRDAAFNDYRFPPLRKEEVKDISIEISLLSPMRRIESLDEFSLGRDGLLMSLNGRRAVFLPSVASETGWDERTFLEELSMKAGLERNAYKNPGAAFDIFQAEVISDEM